MAPSRDFNRGEDITEAQIQQLVAEGITSAGNLQEFRFFTNEFETSTQGIDVILTAPVLNGALSVAYNWTATGVTKYNPAILNEVRVRLLEEGVPRQRANVTLTQGIADGLGVLGRINYYGPWYENAVGKQTYDGAFLVDLEVSYALIENLGITVGVNMFSMLNRTTLLGQIRILRTLQEQSLVDPSVNIVPMGLAARSGILKSVIVFRNKGFFVYVNPIGRDLCYKRIRVVSFIAYDIFIGITFN